MSQFVQRFNLKAYPNKDHFLYHEWQTANIVIFVGEDNRNKALMLAKQKLKEENWKPIEFISKSTLIESRVKEEGGDIWEKYNEAKNGKITFLVFLDEDFIYSKKGGITPMVPPRISESFIDEVIVKAGGHRLSKNEADPDKTKNPDYRIDNYFIELKDLQKEGLNVKSRRIKLAEFYSNITDQDELESREYQILLDILGGPIKNKVRKAAHQIREAKEFLKDNRLRGAIIYLNTGYYSLSHDMFCDIVEKMSFKYSGDISLVMCISSMVDTNGFESMVNYHFYPGTGVCEVESKIHSAFMTQVMKLMTSWSRNYYGESSNPTVIRKPNIFEVNNELMGYLPKPYKSSIDK